MTGIAPNPNLQTFAQLYGTGYQPTSMPNLSASQNAPQPLSAVPAPDLNADNPLEKTPKSDTITIAGKTIKKKTAIMAGLGAFAAVVAIGAAIAFKARTGRTSAASPETRVATEAAEAAVKHAIELTETLQKKVNAVVELFTNGGKDAEGNVIAKISNGTDGSQVMEELAKDGTVSRRSWFKDGILESIDECIEAGELNAIVELFTNGGKDAEGNVIAKISNNALDDSIKYMEEFAEDGITLLRESLFKDGIFARRTSNVRIGKTDNFVEIYSY